MGIDQTLNERGSRYGEFEDHARVSQRIQDEMRDDVFGWSRLADDQKQALTMIADKIARILNGDPAYLDNWHDIIGYATLVERRIQRDEIRTAASAMFHANDNMPNVEEGDCHG